MRQKSVGTEIMAAVSRSDFSGLSFSRCRAGFGGIEVRGTSRVQCLAGGDSSMGNYGVLMYILRNLVHILCTAQRGCRCLETRE